MFPPYAFALMFLWVLTIIAWSGVSMTVEMPFDYVALLLFGEFLFVGAAYISKAKEIGDYSAA